jgi:signal transduction histidine kinase
MFRTIFVKQLVLYIGTLAISFIFLGAVLSQVIRGYITEQKVKSLEQSGSTLASEISSLYSYGLVDMKQMAMQMEIIQMYLKAGLVVVDNELVMQIDSADLKLRRGEALAVKELQALQFGYPVTAQGTFNGAFAENQLIVGYPVKVNGSVVGAIVLYSSLADLNKTIWDLYKATAVCLGVAIAVGVFLISLTSRTMSKPLRQMSKVASQISGGDFEKRVQAAGRDEVAQLAQSLNNMAESLDQHEKGRRDFIANISHDLRSPLTSMRGFIQAIMDGDVPPEKTSHYLGIVLKESERLSKLANDIVDLSQIEAQTIPLNAAAFDINKLIRDTALSFEGKITAKSQVMKLELADAVNYVKADREKIQRVLYNLLDNAVKFTPEGGSISVETSVSLGKVRIEVKDTGIGMSPEVQRKIFDRFYNADESRGMDKVGSGLGLSIAREFTRAHSSQLAVKSAPGEGTAFTFCLDEAGP